MPEISVIKFPSDFLYISSPFIIQMSVLNFGYPKHHLIYGFPLVAHMEFPPSNFGYLKHPSPELQLSCISKHGILSGNFGYPKHHLIYGFPLVAHMEFPPSNFGYLKHPSPELQLSCISKHGILSGNFGYLKHHLVYSFTAVATYIEYST